MAISTGSVGPLLKRGHRVPKVGKKEFPYTKEGKEAAKKEAKKKGKKVMGRFGHEV